MKKKQLIFAIIMFCILIYSGYSTDTFKIRSTIENFIKYRNFKAIHVPVNKVNTGRVVVENTIDETMKTVTRDEDIQTVINYVNSLKYKETWQEELVIKSRITIEYKNNDMDKIIVINASGNMVFFMGKWYEASDDVEKSTLNLFKTINYQEYGTIPIVRQYSNKEIEKIIIKGYGKEKIFDKTVEIDMFINAIREGVPKANIPTELKAPNFFVYVYYADGEKVEYFLYLGGTNGMIIKNGGNERIELSDKSIAELNQLCGQMK